MDFAASEAKKRGQSFPGNSGQSLPETPRNRSALSHHAPHACRTLRPGFVPGTPVDFAGAKNFFAPAGSNSHTKTVDVPHPVTRSRDRGNAHLPVSQPAGSNSRTKAVNMPHPVARSRDRENAPSAGRPACGEQFVPKGCGCAPSGLRRRPAAQNKKGTRIGCLSAWCSD